METTAALNEYSKHMKLKGAFMFTSPRDGIDAVYFAENGRQESIWSVKLMGEDYDQLMVWGGVYFSVDKFLKIANISFFVGIPAFLLLKTSDGLYVKQFGDQRGNKLTYGQDQGWDSGRELCLLLNDFVRGNK